MQTPQKISIHDYTYSLPDERIANYPLPERDASRLLVYNKGEITSSIYKQIAEHIPENSLLIFNNTKVLEARLVFQKPTGGVIEIFCLEPHQKYADITTAMLQKEKVLWHCLVGGASKWKAGQVLEKIILNEGKQIILKAAYVEKKKDSFIIELSWAPQEMSFAEILHYTGAIPLPPYIKRKPETADAERYQTIYAKADGSVAAPTAGLHFTDSIFKSFKTKDIQTDFVTLHVGAGTFKPVKSKTMLEHEMHAEWVDVSRKTIEIILQNLDQNIVAVGTTSLRTMESLYWLGIKKLLAAHEQPEIDNDGILTLFQWEAYTLADTNITAKQALLSLLKWMTKNNRERLIAKTQLLIAPGYNFKIITGLITNFHQPQSTLLLLVAALVGPDWKKIYSYALENNFRFLSYGDGSLLWYPSANSRG